MRDQLNTFQDKIGASLDAIQERFLSDTWALLSSSQLNIAKDQMDSMIVNTRWDIDQWSDYLQKVEEVNNLSHYDNNGCLKKHVVGMSRKRRLDCLNTVEKLTHQFKQIIVPLQEEQAAHEKNVASTQFTDPVLSMAIPSSSYTTGHVPFRPVVPMTMSLHSPAGVRQPMLQLPDEMIEMRRLVPDLK